MKERKWILNNGKIIFGYVKFHNEIPADHKHTTAGGKWFLDKEAHTLYLYDGSSDFGYATFKDISHAEYPKWCQQYSINFQPMAEFLYQIDAKGKLLQEEKETFSLVGEGIA